MVFELKKAVSEVNKNRKTLHLICGVSLGMRAKNRLSRNQGGGSASHRFGSPGQGPNAQKKFIFQKNPQKRSKDQSHNFIKNTNIRQNNEKLTQKTPELQKSHASDSIRYVDQNQNSFKTRNNPTICHNDDNLTQKTPELQ